MIKVDAAELLALRTRLQDLSEKVGKKAVRQAARRAMVPVRDEVKARAPEDLTDDDGVKLKANVALTTRWRGGTLYTRVGIRGGAKKNPNTPYYFRFHEFGTKDMPARPFMAPALESNAQQIIDTVTAELKKALGL